MADQITKYTIFIASPGDTGDEREIVRTTCENLNKRPLVKDRSIRLVPMGWEDAMPQAGDLQEIINKLVAQCDLLICLFHRRFGSPTNTHPSGTLEEFLNAYDRWKVCQKPQIMLYFKEVAIRSISDLKDEQLSRVMEFKELVQKRQNGAL